MKTNGYKKILVPTDFSTCSHAAVDHALTLAKKFGAGLRFIHVIHEMSIYLEGLEGPVVVESLTQVNQELQRQATRRMAVLRLKWPRSQTAIEHGHPSSEIVKAAEAYGADLIVMGTHGRSGLDRVLMGSVAHQVMQKAHCSVLVVKQPTSGRKGKKGRKRGS